MSKKILELKNVNKYFITSDGKTLKACNNINLDIEEGKITGIVGESGMWKINFSEIDSPIRETN